MIVDYVDFYIYSDKDFIFFSMRDLTVLAIEKLFKIINCNFI